MADHDKVEYAAATGNDYAAHEGTYRLFIQMTKWGTILVVITLALMAFFLT